MSSPYRIGSITTGYRPIQDGKKYDKYFPKPETQDRIVIQDGEVTETVELMKRVVWKYINDTKGIAPVLKGGSTKATLQNTRQTVPLIPRQAVPCCPRQIVPLFPRIMGH